ncbi:MAG TPA: bifunctional glutamate N-acetyltransferase/amino-acid acetyltransferase ArgJ [Nitrospirae bacterium]|nr:arginine biosynthesis bifunctional protein ArgJ [bacterium BMS3Abin10]GBE38060.1 arginine biosynthesis bifunctional protein ArgJ [bacterium BMS3Bbin08]HDH51466.1 bifunctional glutamate N-acetyltransferase/amino-acid acetyltransferase ArgJ [Nitrospirota bacterium]HDK16919.1 bifunctional glutamate N-acetyltransferase/amino-acid acetyltransferase ArgJ [Nitrospirota bacterium]HDK41097.1 bifunctional glutamate N-acetyltransferase/amino-acid acetyltransferase ArgJ [Nitrospirota bacterium]
MKKPKIFKKVIVSGFKFAGLASGIKKTGKDLALIFSESPANIAGVFTTNSIKAAPVKLDIRRIRSQKGRAIIINSGNANACTGPQGLKDAREMAAITAGSLGVPVGQVYVASTGLIGRPLPMRKIRKAIPKAAGKLSSGSISDAASAIMTTDTFPKIFSRKIKINGKTATVAGIAKGAGMICPNMATMLSFMVTDIAVSTEALDSALRKAVNTSFNKLTIDGDMSTNDTVMVMANGMLKNTPLTRRSPAYKKFENAIAGIADNLSRMIALDGEGATKLINVSVKGARTEADAEKTARSIADSLLVKTALYGQEPNWGRIMAAVGYSGVRVSEQKISITVNNCQLVRRGAGVNRAPKNLLSPDEITITVDLGLGKKAARVLTCDLTEKYIKINAGYMT